MLLRSTVKFAEKLRNDFSAASGPFTAALILNNAAHVAEIGIASMWKNGSKSEDVEDFQIFREDIEKAKRDLLRIIEQIDFHLNFEANDSAN